MYKINDSDCSNTCVMKQKVIMTDIDICDSVTWMMMMKNDTMKQQ